MAKATILTGTEHNGAAPMVTLYITGHALKRRHLAAILGSQVLSWLGDGATVRQEEGEVEESGERTTPDPRR